ncbi:MAG: glycoside hydrolase family 2 protein [Verrucomicrobiota bacterium]
MHTVSIPRPEYPRPQARRADWLNLNGVWSFAEDPAREGLEAAWFARERFEETIQVPFCREASLSGIGRDAPVPCVWYSREIEIPADWQGQRILLHFGAADYFTDIWIDGQPAGVTHRGGHTSFTYDITPHVRAGQTHRLTVRCEDDPALAKPHGKQRRYAPNSSVCYTQTTGIWQTVWLEPVPVSYLERPRITPSVDRGGFLLEQRVRHLESACTLKAELFADGQPVAEAQQPLAMDAQASLWLAIPEATRRLWEPADPFLYDLHIELRAPDGRLIDRVESYAGLRSVAIRGHRILLNGRSVFQRLVLDQGYYPDGLLTAPSDAALREDIRLGLAHGFNGARFHQKIFEERALYHADREGYLVWAEMPDWGPEFQRDEPKEINARWIEEWLESIERDYSHPCIIGWCPLNEQEAQNPQHLAQIETVQRSMVLATKLADRTRPVLDASGWIHRCPETDLYDDHNYEQDPDKLAARYADMQGFTNTCKGAAANTVSADGKPFFVSELGGMKWVEGEAHNSDASWGYGRPPQSREAYIERFRRQCAAILDNPRCFGYCITQLTDVFQEKNGIADFHRKPKFDPEALRAAQQRPAAIEAPDA